MQSTYTVLCFNEIQKLFRIACENGRMGTILLIYQVLEVLKRMSNIIIKLEPKVP